MNKADQAFWNQYWTTVEPRTASESEPVRGWIEAYFHALSENERRTCIEIGCYPGQFLSIFGRLGYELCGIDLTEKLALLPQWLQESGYRVGKFWKKDFLAFNPRRKFDVVASFGFIEHFTDWREVLARHASLVKDGGHLIVEVPNFVGLFQRCFHIIFDTENYRHHQISAMRIAKWADVLAEHGFEILYEKYFGEFDFWVESRPQSGLRKLALETLERLKPRLRSRLPKDNGLYSPYGGIIARKLRQRGKARRIKDGCAPI